MIMMNGKSEPQNELLPERSSEIIQSAWCQKSTPTTMGNKTPISLLRQAAGLFPVTTEYIILCFEQWSMFNNILK